MRVQQREGRGLRHRRAAAEGGATAGRRQRLRLARAAQRLPAVGGQEGRAHQRQRARQRRPLAQRLRHAQHAGGDQQCIGQRAEQHHAAHVLAPQALAQHEGVLRADGDDQAEAQGQPLGEHGQGVGVGEQRCHGAPACLPVAHKAN